MTQKHMLSMYGFSFCLRGRNWAMNVITCNTLDHACIECRHLARAVPVAQLGRCSLFFASFVRPSQLSHTNRMKRTKCWLVPLFC